MPEGIPAPRTGLALINTRPQYHWRGFLTAVAGCLVLSACAAPKKAPDWSIVSHPMAVILPKAEKPSPNPPPPSPSEPQPPQTAEREAPEPPPAAEPPKPRLVAVRRPLQCVPYARRKSQIAIWGDSWRWWRTAAGRYQRGYEPRNSAVLVFERNRRSRGHLAVVEHVLSDREIVVSHANWLNRGRIHMNTPVQDVSLENDWSAVRVWYIPGGKYGSATYRTQGFIYRARQPTPYPARTRPLTPTS